jgi:excinuclease UvrABC ATPase subunit
VKAEQFFVAKSKSSSAANQYLRNPHFYEEGKSNGTDSVNQHDVIEVFGARVHNLKNIDIAIPKKQVGRHHRDQWQWKIFTGI